MFAARAKWFVVALVATGALTAIVVSRRASPDTIVAGAGAPEVVASVVTDLPVLDDGPAPTIESGDGWLNTAPLRDVDLRNKVVLYDFWTFGCSNCKNTLPYVKAWHARYADDGLVILSIHTPEFAYEADAANVAEFVGLSGIEYPVALDPERAVWNDWDNHYWPAFYLYDRDGKLRLQHFGEGGYERREDAIRLLLGVDPSSPRAQPITG